MFVSGLVPLEHELLEKPDFVGSKHLSAIQRRGVLRVAVNPDMPNFSSRDPADGQLKGLEIDLAKHLARSLFGCHPSTVLSHLEFVETKFSHRIESLTERAADVAIAVLVDTPERRKEVSFAGYYMVGKPALLASSSCPEITDVSDLNDVRISVLSGSTGEFELHRRAPHAHAVIFDTVTECVDAIKRGSVDAFWSTTAENVTYLRDPATNVHQVNLKLVAEPWAIGVVKDADDVVRFVNDATADLLTTGMLSRLLQHWLSDGTI